LTIEFTRTQQGNYPCNLEKSTFDNSPRLFHTTSISTCET
jgi:hypothetical protein